MFDQGTGPPLVVVPGIQGRWEWFSPALRELSRRCRTVSYTLAGDLGARFVYEPELGFENYTRQLDAVLDRAGIERAAICGVSYGGLIALRYAATRPRRVSALVLASSPAPGWTPNEQQARYVARPWLSAPAFVLTAPMRILPEIHAAFDTWRAGAAFTVRHAARVLAAPMLPPVMARRVTVQQALDFQPDCAAVRAPTLVLSGEPQLDRIVPVEVTRSYERLIPGARYEMIERTGHLGLITRPKRFAELVADFTHAHDR